MVNFISEKISPTVTRIHGITDEQMYLVEGSQRAALIDTGSGVGSLRTYVEGLTDKPVIVLLTHGHLDHAMGAPEFDTVYMSRKDHYIYNAHCDMELRKEYLSQAPDFAKVEEQDYIPIASCSSFHDLKEGDSFDLGGITIQIFECPGHTLGSVVMLLKEERALITGDACNTFTFLFDWYTTDLLTYESSLRRLLAQTEESFDRIYLSHRNSDAPKELIRGVLQVCDDIKSGRTDDIPFEFMGQTAYIAKAILTEDIRLDGGVGNIVYNKNNIYPPNTPSTQK